MEKSTEYAKKGNILAIFADKHTQIGHNNHEQQFLTIFPRKFGTFWAKIGKIGVFDGLKFL